GGSWGGFKGGFEVVLEREQGRKCGLATSRGTANDVLAGQVDVAVAVEVRRRHAVGIRILAGDQLFRELNARCLGRRLLLSAKNRSKEKQDGYQTDHQVPRMPCHGFLLAVLIPGGFARSVPPD